MKSFKDLLQARWDAGKFVCVGLDPDIDKIPIVQLNYDPTEPPDYETIARDFFGPIIEATRDNVCAYKPNAAFFEAFGIECYIVLAEVIELIRELAPDVPVILDYKRGDIGNTNNGPVALAFDELEVDAVTVNPYFGAEAMKPFLDRSDKGVFVLVRTSNPGASELQDLEVISKQVEMGGPGIAPLYSQVAFNVASPVWNNNDNCGVVAGATNPDELLRVRLTVGESVPILIPGVGAQGGDLEAAVTAGLNTAGQGIIINSSRGIIYASDGPDFADAAGTAARELNEQIVKIIAQPAIR